MLPHRLDRQQLPYAFDGVAATAAFVERVDDLPIALEIADGEHAAHHLFNSGAVVVAEVIVLGEVPLLRVVLVDLLIEHHQPLHDLLVADVVLLDLPHYVAGLAHERVCLHVPGGVLLLRVVEGVHKAGHDRQHHVLLAGPDVQRNDEFWHLLQHEHLLPHETHEEAEALLPVEAHDSGDLYRLAQHLLQPLQLVATPVLFLVQLRRKPDQLCKVARHVLPSEHHLRREGRFVDFVVAAHHVPLQLLQEPSRQLFGDLLERLLGWVRMDHSLEQLEGALAGVWRQPGHPLNGRLLALGELIPEVVFGLICVFILVVVRSLLKSIRCGNCRFLFRLRCVLLCGKNRAGDCATDRFIILSFCFDGFGILGPRAHQLNFWDDKS